MNSANDWYKNVRCFECLLLAVTAYHYCQLAKPERRALGDVDLLTWSFKTLSFKVSRKMFTNQKMA